jgi:hypothetical protein
MESFAQLEAAVAGLASTIDLLEYRREQLLLEQEPLEDDHEVAGFLASAR